MTYGFRRDERPCASTSRIWTVRSLLGLAVAGLALLVSAVPSATAATGYIPAGAFAGAPSLGCPSVLPGELCSPRRIAVDADSGQVFVVDSGNDRVQIFEPDGDSLAYVSEIGGLDDPYGIAIDQAASPVSVYVSLAGANEIVKLDSDGAPTPTFTESASFVSPVAGAGAGRLGSFRAPLAVDPTDQSLLVADAGKNLVQRFSADGAFVSDFDGSGSPDGTFTHLEDVAVSDSGEIFVADAQGGPAADGNPSRVDRFSAAGGHQASVRAPQSEGDGLIALDASGGTIVVGDARGFSGANLRVIDAATLQRTTAMSVPGAVQLTGIAVGPGATGRLYAVTDDPFCGGGCGPVGIQVYERNTLPAATVDPVGAVTLTTAELSGSVDPNGSDTTARFELSTDAGASWTPLSDLDPAPGDGDDPVNVTHTATDLQPGTPYEVRLVAAYPGGGQVESASESFTTDAAVAPAVTFEPPVVAGETATLTGTVDPQGLSTSYYFEYSTDGGGEWIPRPGSLIPFCENPFGCSPPMDCYETDGCWRPHPVDAGAGTDPVAAEVTLPLDPAATYQVRLVATNAGGTTTSAVETFDMAGEAPVVVTANIGNRLHDETWVAGYVNPRNQPTAYWFEWGTTADYGNRAPVAQDGDAGDGTIARSVGQRLTGLQPETTYHYRLVAQNATATVHGDDRSFTTRPAPAPRGKGVGADGDRAYELVSTPDQDAGVKGGMLSDGGERVLYFSNGGLPGSSFGHVGALLATRTSSGWKSENPMPPNSLLGSPGGLLLGASWDLSRFFLRSTEPSGEDATGGVTTYWRYVPATKELEQGARIVAGAHRVSVPTMSPVSADMRHTLVSLNLEPQGAPQTQIYDVLAGPQPAAVGILPDGSLPPCGIAPDEMPAPITADQRANWMSADGQRLFFHARAGADCSVNSNLYTRAGGVDGSTTLISGPPLSGPDRGARFTRAAPDGSWVFFTTATRLDPADGNDTGDLYRWTIEGENECVTCIVPEAAVTTGAMPPNMLDAQRVLVAENGSRAYFVSSRALADGATEGGKNLYVWRGGTAPSIGFVAPIDGFDVTHFPTAWTTPDGAVMTFSSSRPELDALTGSENAVDQNQYYRYDDRDGSLACASCPAGREATRSAEIVRPWGLPENVKQTMLPDDGRSFAFGTPERLVAEDVNGGVDVYEWRDGRVGLLTDGRSITRSGALAASVQGFSRDGRTVLINWTGKPLVGGAGVDSPQALYVARTGGGFAEPVPSAACQGDACQGAPGALVAPPVAASISFAGAGNAASPRGAAGPEVSVARRAVRGSAFTVRVRVPGKGRIVVSGRGVRRVEKVAPKPARYALRIGLTARAKQALERRRTLRVRVRVRYVSAAGRTSVAFATVTFAQPKSKRGGR